MAKIFFSHLHNERVLAVSIEIGGHRTPALHNPPEYKNTKENVDSKENNYSHFNYL